jgi:hypothetical protein
MSAGCSRGWTAGSRMRGGEGTPGARGERAKGKIPQEPHQLITAEFPTGSHQGNSRRDPCPREACGETRAKRARGGGARGGAENTRTPRSAARERASSEEPLLRDTVGRLQFKTPGNPLAHRSTGRAGGPRQGAPGRGSTSLESRGDAEGWTRGGGERKPCAACVRGEHSLKWMLCEFENLV